MGGGGVGRRRGNGEDAAGATTTVERAPRVSGGWKRSRLGDWRIRVVKRDSTVASFGRFFFV